MGIPIINFIGTQVPEPAPATCLATIHIVPEPSPKIILTLFYTYDEFITGTYGYFKKVTLLWPVLEHVHLLKSLLIFFDKFLKFIKKIGGLPSWTL